MKGKMTFEEFVKFYNMYQTYLETEDDTEAPNQKFKDNSDSDYTFGEDYRTSESDLLNLMDKAFDKDIKIETVGGYQKHLKYKIWCVISFDQHNDGHVDIFQDRIEAKLSEKADIKLIDKKITTEGGITHNGMDYTLFENDLCYVRFVYDVERKEPKHNKK